jgi:citrate synthase
MSRQETTQSKEFMESHQYSKGLEGVVAAETALSLVDGQESKLYYRGIQVHELVENSNFEEVAFLLWNGALPKAAELADFTKKLASQRVVRPEALDVLKKIPKTAHPMGVLRTVVSLLGLFDPSADGIDLENNRRKAFCLVGAFPTVIAAFHRIRQNQEPIAPNLSLSHAANFYYMMQGKQPVPEMEKALDAYLILLADHGLNASTFAARVTCSTQSDMYSAVTSAVGTLKGDLHGSANQRAMEMILDISDPAKAEAYVKNILVKKEKVMGFGHRIYKHEDPRAVAFQSIAEKMCARSGEKKWMDISNIVKRVMWEDKKIPCNVDFYSASVLYILGFPVDFFTTVFAASRVAGWCAHVIEQLSNNRLIRPASNYTGPLDQHYVPMNQRK